MSRKRPKPIGREVGEARPPPVDPSQILADSEKADRAFVHEFQDRALNELVPLFRSLTKRIVGHGDVTHPDGSKAEVLAVAHGPFVLIVHSLPPGGVLHIVGMIGIDAQTSVRLGKTRGADAKLRGHLAQALLTGRSGYAFLPQSATEGPLNQIRIEQIFPYEVGSISSRTRACDAVQELVVDMMRAMIVLQHRLGQTAVFSTASEPGHMFG